MQGSCRSVVHRSERQVTEGLPTDAGRTLNGPSGRAAVRGGLKPALRKTQPPTRVTGRCGRSAVRGGLKSALRKTSRPTGADWPARSITGLRRAKTRLTRTVATDEACQVGLVDHLSVAGRCPPKRSSPPTRGDWPARPNTGPFRPISGPWRAEARPTKDVTPYDGRPGGLAEHLLASSRHERPLRSVTRHRTLVTG